MDTNETTAIAKAGPEDMIATVWFNLGYKPHDSLIVIGIEGARQRAGVMLRADLPSSNKADRSGEAVRPIDRLSPEALRAALPEMVRDLLVTVAASGAHGVLAVVADERALDRRPPAVVRLLRDGVREFGLQLVDVFGVTSTAFTSLLCRDPRCCPPSGRPIEQVLSSRSAAVHVVGGDTVAESEAELLADVTRRPSDPPCDPPSGLPLGGERPADDPDPGRPPRPAEPGGSAGLPQEQRWQWWERWNQACAEASRVPSRGAPLSGFSAALHDWYLRDAVLMSLFGAGPGEVRAMLDGDTRELAADRFHHDLGRLLRQRPDVERLNAGLAVLAGAVRVAGAGDRGPALAVLAMLAWFEGRGGRARLLVGLARTDAPSVSLIRLVQDLLVERVPPPWLRNGPEG